MSEAKKTTKFSPYTTPIARIDDFRKQHEQIYGGDDSHTKFWGSLKAGTQALAAGKHDEARAHLDAAEQHVRDSTAQDLERYKDPVGQMSAHAGARSQRLHIQNIRDHVVHASGIQAPHEGSRYHREAAGGMHAPVPDSGPVRVHHHLANAYAEMSNAAELKQPHRHKSVQEDLDHARNHAQSLPADHELHRHIAQAQAMNDGLKGGTMAKADNTNRFQAIAEASLLAFARR